MIKLQQTPLEMQKAITQLRSGAGQSPEFKQLKNEIKQFQNNRLKKTYQDLLQQADTQLACRFFLEQLYCTQDISLRDHQVERVLPKLEKLLPGGAVDTVAKVIYMDYLAELMDDEITRLINQKDWYSENSLQEKAYIAAFRAHDRFDLREQQVMLIGEVGESLRRLMRLPLLKPLMKMTRGAAQKANLEDFHNFLSDGLAAFASLQRPTLFFQLIHEREMSLLEGIRQGTLESFETS